MTRRILAPICQCGKHVWRESRMAWGHADWENTRDVDGLLGCFQGRGPDGPVDRGEEAPAR